MDASAFFYSFRPVHAQVTEHGRLVTCCVWYLCDDIVMYDRITQRLTTMHSPAYLLLLFRSADWYHCVSLLSAQLLLKCNPGQ